MENVNAGCQSEKEELLLKTIEIKSILKMSSLESDDIEFNSASLQKTESWETMQEPTFPRSILGKDECPKKPRRSDAQLARQLATQLAVLMATQPPAQQLPATHSSHD
jgi:hypothetical protein